MVPSIINQGWIITAETYSSSGKLNLVFYNYFNGNWNENADQIARVVIKSKEDVIKYYKKLLKDSEYYVKNSLKVQKYTSQISEVSLNEDLGFKKIRTKLAIEKLDIDDINVLNLQDQAMLLKLEGPKTVDDYENDEDDEDDEILF